MGENSFIELGAGRMFFTTENGDVPIGSVQSVEIEAEERVAQPFICGVDLAKDASFTAECKMPLSEWLKILFWSCPTSKELLFAIIRIYPNKRVSHLATRHKKSRVRKKNIQRILDWVIKEISKK